jgi:hypothetical protein
MFPITLRTVVTEVTLKTLVTEAQRTYKVAAEIARQNNPNTQDSSEITLL